MTSNWWGENGNENSTTSLPPAMGIPPLETDDTVEMELKISEFLSNPIALPYDVTEFVLSIARKSKSNILMFP